MPRQTFKTEQPVVLEGFQAVMKPSKFGYSLSTLITQDLIDKLEADREDNLKWAVSKLKNPKRSVLKPEPWEEVTEGMYKVKFSWNEESRPPIVDTEGTLVTDPNTPLYSGSTVKVGFYQKPYILKDGITYGTSLKLVGAQIITLNSGAGVDTGTLSADAVADLFGKAEGFVQSEPNVTATAPTEATDDEDGLDF